jgi:hypothetical protein
MAPNPFESVCKNSNLVLDMHLIYENTSLNPTPLA